MCLLIGLPDLVQAQQRPIPKAAATPAQSGVINWALGNARAPVTLVEYASLTCGHCAAFHTNVLPGIKRRFIDTGKVRYVLRPFPTPPFELSVAMHALTMCSGPSRYYPLIDAFFVRQREIFAAASGETGPKGTLFSIAEDAGGLSYSASEACLIDPTRQTQVRTNSEAGLAQGVRGTPTLYVNNILVTPQNSQALTEEDVAAAIMVAQRNLAARSQGQTPGKSKAKKR